MRLSTALLAALVVAGLIVILGPVRVGLEQRDISEFSGRAAVLETEIQAGFRESLSAATDFASRPVLTEQFRGLTTGQLSLREYRSFADPRLAQIVEQRRELKAYARITAEGEVLTNIGFQWLPQMPGTAEAAILPDLVTVGGERCLLAAAPVILADGAEPGAWDIVAYALGPILNRGVASLQQTPETCFRLGSASGSAMVRWPKPRSENEGPCTADLMMDQMVVGPAAGLTPGSPVQDRPIIGDEPYHAVLAGLGYGWGSAVAAPIRSIHQHTRRQLARLVLSAGIASVLAIVGQITLLQMYGKRLRHESRELAGLVAERTEALTHALSEKDLLIREVHHRIKNDMHLVQSLLALRRRETTEPTSRDSLQDAEATVAMMARVYERLYRGRSWGQVEVRPVLESLLKEDLAEMALLLPYSVDTEISELRIPQQTAVSLGIIVNELATNAIKHGADEDGGVHLHVVVREQDGGGLLVAVCDSGPGFPQDQMGGVHGSGLGLLSEIVSGMGGEIRAFNDGGACAEIRLPAGCMVC